MEAGKSEQREGADGTPPDESPANTRDDELSRDALAILAATRRELGPSEKERRRLLAGVLVSVQEESALTSVAAREGSEGETGGSGAATG